ncbi:Mycobacterium numidiamassiliense ORFan [Mycobacterium numidiamassiliense]|uniref:Mycobacterium numidiamassiliense ORFan n=1 Tax=Mycobacterium numidiamassiliense TaxID=1841861 RepID=A0A2U3PFA8_9MYCO|nr:Mycobacterium numidiamassiliense ORFan [Mycobacterium numidiamassiliense]
MRPKVTKALGFGAFAPLPHGGIQAEPGRVRAIVYKELGYEIAHRVRFEVARQYPPHR